jgi:hypothetical protein
MFGDAELRIKVAQNRRLSGQQGDDFGETLKLRDYLALLLVLMSLVVDV